MKTFQYFPDAGRSPILHDQEGSHLEKDSGNQKNRVTGGERIRTVSFF